MFGLSGAQWNFQSHDWSSRPSLHTKTMVLFNPTTSLIQFTAKPHKYWCWLHGEGRNRQLGRGIHVLHGQNITACAVWTSPAESSDCGDKPGTCTAWSEEANASLASCERWKLLYRSDSTSVRLRGITSFWQGHGTVMQAAMCTSQRYSPSSSKTATEIQ